MSHDDPEKRRAYDRRNRRKRRAYERRRAALAELEVRPESAVARDTLEQLLEPPA